MNNEPVTNTNKEYPKKKGISVKFLISLGIILIIIILAVILVSKVIYNSDISKNINNFDECIEAGNPVVAGTYPIQCKTLDGKLFISTSDNIENKPKHVDDLILVERQATNFEECLNWGFVSQGYPEYCTDGNFTFINPKHTSAPTIAEQQICSADDECTGLPNPCHRTRACINKKWVSFYNIKPAACTLEIDPLAASPGDCVCLNTVCTNKKLIQS